MRILLTIIISFFFSSVIGLGDVYESVDVGGGVIQWYNTTTNTQETPPSTLPDGDTAIVHHDVATCDRFVDLASMSTLTGQCITYNITTLNGQLIINNGAGLFIPQPLTIQTTGILIIKSGSALQVNGTISNTGGYVENNGLLRFNGSLNNNSSGVISGSGGSYECRGSLINSDVDGTPASMKTALILPSHAHLESFR